MDIIREYKMAKTSAIMLAQKFIISIIDMVRSCSFENDRLSPEACISSLKYVHNVNSLKLLLLKYTYECIKTSKENAPFASNPEIARVVEYVNKNLDKEISLDSAARYICMNSSYFSRFFKNKTGENFVDFLSRVRIERAKQLILDTNLTIDEISQKVGYVNKSYFSRVFKKMTGMAPGQFRRLHKVNYSQEA